MNHLRKEERAEEAGGAPIGESRVRLLLVEDNPDDARLTIEALKEGGEGVFEVAEANCLETALKMIGEERPDVVLLDLTLPDSDALETFEKVREAAPDMALIVLSGLDDEDVAAKTVQMGGQDYLLKGHIEGPLLAWAIRHALARKRAENDLRQLRKDLQRVDEELHATQLQLIQAEKMESLGRLAAGVAHEVKNPLARIILGAEYLEGGISDDDDNIPRILEEIKEAALRAEKIVGGMVDFSGHRRADLKNEDINEVVGRALLMVKHELTRTKTLLVPEFAEELPKVKLDRGKMEQVLVNLLMNALHAMKEAKERKLTVRTWAGVLTEFDPNEGVRTKDHPRQNDEVVFIEIEDTGCGVPEEKLDKIFDPFFTTKATGEGTGLGLTVVQKIVDLHNGLIKLENVVGGGAKATITLKAASSTIE